MCRIGTKSASSGCQASVPSPASNCGNVARVVVDHAPVELAGAHDVGAAPRETVDEQALPVGEVANLAEQLLLRGVAPVHRRHAEVVPRGPVEIDDDGLVPERLGDRPRDRGQELERSPPARTSLVTSSRPRSGEMGGSDGVATGARESKCPHPPIGISAPAALPLKGEERGVLASAAVAMFWAKSTESMLIQNACATPRAATTVGAKPVLVLRSV